MNCSRFPKYPGFKRRPGQLGRSASSSAMMARGLRYVERRFDGLVQLRDFAGVACTHQPLQSVARNREYVVEEWYFRSVPDNSAQPMRLKDPHV